MKKIFLLVLGVILMLEATADAKSIRTPEGNMPRVQWAVVESTDSTMPQIIDMGARILASTSANETGTYALYGVIEKNNPNLMRLLEIYESDEAYRIHSTSPAFQQYRAERLPILAGLKILPVNGIVLEQKAHGVGTVVQTHDFEIAPADLAKFQQLISDEAIRAVREESGVMGAFVTAELPRPNFLHTMIIFRDAQAAQKYFASNAYKNFRRQVAPLIRDEQTIDYQPTTIHLSEKSWETLHMKKILCVVTSNNVKGATGIPTGFWLSELTHPLEKFSAAGFDYALASIKGGKPPIDGDSLDFNDAINKKFWDDANFQAKLANTLKLDDVTAADFDAIFFAGGHGVMWDFADSAAIDRVTREIYERGGIVSAVCHGPAAPVNVKLNDGKFLVDGKNLTAFTNAEESDVQATDIVPYLLETALKNHGAIHHAAANWSNHVVTDGRLVTGQNPASAAAVGDAVVKLLT